MENLELNKKLASYNLDSKTLKEISKNDKVTKALIEIKEICQIDVLDKKLGNIIYALVTKSSWMEFENVIFVSNYIKDGRVSTNIQLEEILNYFKNNNKFDKTNEQHVKDFESSAGIGIVYTQDEI